MPLEAVKFPRVTVDITVGTMDTEFLQNLAWLPLPPKDFRESCRAALDEPNGFGNRLGSLSNYRHDENGLSRLAKLMRSGRKKGYRSIPFVRIAWASFPTPQPITFPPRSPQPLLGTVWRSNAFRVVMAKPSRNFTRPNRR